MLNLHITRIRRNDLFLFRRPRLAAIALFTICVALLGAGVWPLRVIEIGRANRERGASQAFHDQIRRGLGREVRFASAKDSRDKVGESVWQVDRFIFERSGLKMSGQTRERLISMESGALERERRIKVDELADVLTDTALDRLSTLTDKDIQDAQQALLSDRQFIQSRASGGTYLTPDEFAAQARAARDGAQQNDELVRTGLRSFVGEQVRDRASFLGEALPESFGGASDQGLTPLQAVLITYSIASDDLLNGSQVDLQEAVKRVNQAQGKVSAKGAKPELAYGPGGRIFPTPLNLVFNAQTVNGLLDRIEKGGAK